MQPNQLVMGIRVFQHVMYDNQRAVRKLLECYTAVAGGDHMKPMLLEEEKMRMSGSAHREERQGGEGLGSSELVAKEHVDAKGEDRDEYRDGVEREAEQRLHDGAAPQRAKLLVAHCLDAVPH